MSKVNGCSNTENVILYIQEFYHPGTIFASD